jgi:hypothetical protein
VIAVPAVGPISSWFSRHAIVETTAGRVAEIAPACKVRRRVAHWRREAARMAKRQYHWVRVKVLNTEEKAAIASACERAIAETLRPKFLPEIRPTPQNYPVDIRSRWRLHSSVVLEEALRLVATGPVLRPPI